MRYKKATKKQVDKIKDLAERNQLSIEAIDKLSQTAASQLIRDLERGVQMHELLKVVKSCKTLQDVKALSDEDKAKVPDIVALDSQIEEWYLESHSVVVGGLIHEEWWEVYKSWVNFKLYYEQEMKKDVRF